MSGKDMNMDMNQIEKDCIEWLEEVWREEFADDELDPKSPLHAAIIREAAESGGGPVEGLEVLAQDVTRFADAVRASVRRRLRGQRRRS